MSARASELGSAEATLLRTWLAAARASVASGATVDISTADIDGRRLLAALGTAVERVMASGGSKRGQSAAARAAAWGALVFGGVSAASGTVAAMATADS